MPHASRLCVAASKVFLLVMCSTTLCTQAAHADDAPLVLVELVRLDDWLADLNSDNTEQRDTAAAKPPLFTPQDLSEIVDALLSAAPEIQQLIINTLKNQLISTHKSLGDASRLAWIAALRSLQESLLPPIGATQTASETEAQSLVEATLSAAASLDEKATRELEQRKRHGAYAAVLRPLGMLLADEEWEELENAYRIPELRASVLEIWSGLRAPALRSFLETRMLSTDEAELLDLIPAYVAAYPDDSARMLTELAKSTQYGPVFWACLDHLSNAGVLPSQISAARPDFSQEESQRYVRYTLRGALARADAGDCDFAERVFVDIAERNVSAQAVRASLQGLANCGYANLHRVSLGYINDPAHRASIVHLLSARLSPEGDQQLRANWTSLPPLTQAALLQVFQARNPETAAPILSQASNSVHAVVRYQAAILSGTTPNEDDLWQLVAMPPAWLQQEAARAYLALAAARVERGEVPEARRQYLALLQGGMSVDVELAAIEGIGKTGEPSDKEILSQLAAEAPLRDTSQRAMIALAGRSGNAEDKADAVGAMASGEVPQQEMSELVAGISDPEVRSKTLLRAGFLPDGLVAGPFPQPEGTSIQQLHFPLLPYPLSATVQYSGKEYPFSPLAACADGTRFNLNACMPPEDPGAATSAYAVYEVRLPALTGVYLHIHHDAGFAVWINGKFQRSEPPAEMVSKSWYRLPAIMEPGLTYIVVKLPRGSGGWHTGLRVTLRDGKPLDLTRQAMPEDPLKPVGVESGEVRQLLDKLP